MCPQTMINTIIKHIHTIHHSEYTLHSLPQILLTLLAEILLVATPLVAAITAFVRIDTNKIFSLFHPEPLVKVQVIVDNLIHIQEQSHLILRYLVLVHSPDEHSTVTHSVQREFVLQSGSKHNHLVVVGYFLVSGGGDCGPLVELELRHVVSSEGENGGYHSHQTQQTLQD